MNSDVLKIESDHELTIQIEGIGRGPLCLDTEADSFHHYREKVCLVQLSFAGRDLLVDPLAGVDLRLLGPVLADPGVRKILHGADYDLRLLDRDYGLEIRGLFDTMLAARLTGEPAFGLSALLKTHLDLEMDKSLQRADWSRRPLPPEMQAYAAMDTRHLEQLTEILEQRLAQLGRATWAAEEFERLEGVRWSGERDRTDAYLKIKGAQKLSPRSRAVLRELFEVREQAARERDVPLFRVMRDGALLRLAERRPRNPGELTDVREMPRSWSQGKRADQVIEAVDRGLSLPESELPVQKRAPGTRRDPELEKQVRELRAGRDEIAAKLQLDPPLVASRKLLEELCRLGREGLEEGAIPDLRRWQAAVLHPLF